MALCLRWDYGIFEYGWLEPSPLFNSDGLYLADLWRDVLSGGSLADWNLPHATYLVPDLPLWILVDTLTPSIPWAVLLFGLSQVAAVSIITRMFVVKQYGPWAAPLGPGAWAVVFFIIGLNRAIEALDALKPVHHFSIGIVGLLSVALLARCLRSTGWKWWTGLVALMFGLTLSDPFAISCVWGPVVGLLMLVVIRERHQRLKRVGLVVALLVAGYLGYWLIGKITRVTGDVGSIKLSGVAEQWGNIKTAFAGLEPGPIDGLAMFGVLCFIPLFVRGLLRLKTPTLWALLDLFPLSALVCNEAMLIVSGNRWPTIFHRYQIDVYVYLVVTLARVVAWATQRPLAQKVTAGAAALATLGGGISMFRLADHPRAFVFTSYVPDAAKCLEQVAGQGYVLKRGIADFWNARLTTLLNHQGLRVDELFASGQPRFWLNTTRWFHRTDLPINFILLHYTDPRSVQAWYGPPTQEFICGDQVVWWYAEDREARITALVDQNSPRRPKPKLTPPAQ